MQNDLHALDHPQVRDGFENLVELNLFLLLVKLFDFCPGSYVDEEAVYLAENLQRIDTLVNDPASADFLEVVVAHEANGMCETGSFREYGHEQGNRRNQHRHNGVDIV